MPLPETAIRLSQGSSSNPPKPAYLVRFPEEIWSTLEQNPSGISLSFDDGVHLNIPGSSSITLTSQQIGTSTEIHCLQSIPSKNATHSHTLTPHSIASTRLSIPPTTSASGSRAADRLKKQNESIEQERKDRADRLNGKLKSGYNGLRESPSMARTNSAPPTATPSHTPTPGIGCGSAGSGGPVIPLKTRVVQLLALGVLSVDDIVRRVGMTEQEVMRVVKVVGRETADGCYTLQPNKYNQVKIGPWKYTYAEKMLVIRRAREAYDEIGLPPDAEERAELERKEAEVINGVSSNGSVSDSGPSQTPVPAPVPAPVAVSPPKEKKEAPREKKEKGSIASKKGLGLIGKQKAKFAAEKRASSLPNSRKPDGTASPRAGTPVLTEPLVASDVAKASKRKREDEGGSRKRAGSPGSTQSSKSSEETRGRQRERQSSVQEKVLPPRQSDKEKSLDRVKEKEKTDPKPADQAKVKDRPPGKSKLRKSREYSSSESDSDEPIKEKRGKKEKSPLNPTVPPPAPTSRTPSEGLSSSRTFKRKPPPPELKLNGHRDPPPDPETLRERYEELYPAYQLLTTKLATLHRDAEGEEEGEVVEMNEKELDKMVKRWEKWHTELEGIRRWFGEV